MILDTFDQSGTKTYLDVINPISFSGNGGGVSPETSIFKKIFFSVFGNIFVSFFGRVR